MKLLYCKNCGDIFSLNNKLKTCNCGSTGGKYLDELNAVYHGEAIPIGFSNISIIQALDNQPLAGLGRNFVAFVIPQYCDTMKKLTTDEVRKLSK